MQSRFEKMRQIGASTPEILELGPSRVGGKAYNLARLEAAGMCVPPFFAVTTAAFRSALETNGVAVASLLAADPQRVRSQVQELPLPGELALELDQALAKLHFPVAVRSSAVGEDSAMQSFAGQLDTFLYLQEPCQVHEAIKACWASAFSDRALAYRQQMALDCLQSSAGPGAPAALESQVGPHANQSSLDSGFEVGVVVQELVAGQVSGVAFSANPVNGSRQECVVSATYGLGEGLVSGLLDADQWVVAKEPEWRLLSSNVVRKSEAVVPDVDQGKLTCRAEVPEDRQLEPCLTAEQVLEVGRVASRLAEEFGCQQDIEWTYHGSELYVLQARPITALATPDAGAGPNATEFGYGTQAGAGPFGSLIPFSGAVSSGIGARPAGTADQATGSGKRSLFDNSNIVENFAGVTTPLTFSFASRAYEAIYTQLGEAMGFMRRDIARNSHLLKNMIGFVQGRIFYNLGNWYELLTHFPGYRILQPFFAKSIGAKTDGAPGEGLAVSVLGVVRVVGRMIWNYLTLDRQIRGFFANFEAVYARFKARSLDELTIDQLIDRYWEMERDLIWNWTAPHVNDFYAMVGYGLLEVLIKAWRLDDGNCLQNDLLCGEGQIVSTQPTVAILAIARYIYQDHALYQRLKALPPSQWGDVIFSGNTIARDAVEGRGQTPPPCEEAFAPLAAMIVDYLDRYGYRCMGELKLESVPLTEDPGFLYQAIANALVSAERQGPQALDFALIESRERGIRSRAEEKVRQRLAPWSWRRGAFQIVLNMARKAVKNRENTRFARTKAFGLAREIFSRVGKRLSQRGVLRDPRDIYFLTLDEIVGWSEGRSATLDLASLVALRQAEFAKYATAAIPDRFETWGPVYLAATHQAGNPAEQTVASGSLTGTPCCPGQVKGQARVIRSPADNLELAGEILVAERTDPGWVPLYSCISGLLIERGSILSHAAIVARELGLPTIVGLKGLMRAVSDGQYLEMDAQLGTVYLNRQPDQGEKTVAKAATHHGDKPVGAAREHACKRANET